MTETVFRERCLVCRQAEKACWCGQVPQIRPRAQLVLLQHPREARNTVGTARMAHLAVPGSQLLIGVRFEEERRFRGLLERERGRSVILYPTPEARPISELVERAGPLTIWAIDGTWSQANTIWKQNPSLHGLPAYRIDPERPSRYLIRAEPAPHCLSSVEAVAAALDASEGAPGRHSAMLEPLYALVERQQAHSRSDQRSPRRHVRMPRVRHYPFPRALQGRHEHALLVHGEGNAWPSRLAERPPTELVQWLALRPATGERFGMLIRPEGAPVPTTEAHLGLSPEALAAAPPPADWLSAWRAFVRPEDVWCSWGHTPINLALGAGLDPPPIVDLRAWSHLVLSARPGRIEAAHEALIPAAGPPRADDFPGRGGRRLPLLDAIFRRLSAISR